MSYIPTITQLRGLLPDPAPTWMWSVVLPNDIAGFQATQYSLSTNYAAVTTNPALTGGLLTTPTVPFGRVQNLNLPGITLDTDPRFVAGQMIHYPRHLTVDELSINFYEDMNYNSMNYLTCWTRMIVDRNHNWAPPKTYKKDIYFFAFDGVDAGGPRLVGRIKQAFPTNPGVGLQWEATSSGIVVIPCTFSVKDVELSFLPKSG